MPATGGYTIEVSGKYPNKPIGELQYDGGQAPASRSQLEGYKATFQLNLVALNGAPVPDAYDWDVGLSEVVPETPIDLLIIDDVAPNNTTSSSAVGFA